MLITCDDIGRIPWCGDWLAGICPRQSHLEDKCLVLLSQRISSWRPAFGVSGVMIPAFKKPRGAAFSWIHEVFNTYLAKPQVKAEHCIGMFKGRFQYFKRMRDFISSQKILKWTVKQFQCACILHNWLLLEPVSPNWTDLEEENVSDNNYGATDTVVDTIEGTERLMVLLAYIMEKNNIQVSLNLLLLYISNGIASSTFFCVKSSSISFFCSRINVTLAIMCAVLATIVI